MGIGFANLRDRRIQRQAARWRVEMLESHSPELGAEFETWRAADPAHARAYDELARFTTLARRLPRAEHRRLQPFGGGHRQRPVFGAAAVAALVIVGLLLTSRPPPAPYLALSNPGPGIRLLQLTDGSTVTLDVGTDLTVTMNSASREARLRRGRARFRVVAEPGRPFIIRLPTGRVEAGGSEFDLALNQDQTIVMPVRGNVRVFPTGTDGQDPVAVGAGAAVRVEGGHVAATPVSRQDRLWTVGRLYFNHAPLAAIVATANRLGGPPIRLAPEAIGSRAVTAVLDLRDTRALARKLAAALDLKVAETGGTIVLSR